MHLPHHLHPTIRALFPLAICALAMAAPLRAQSASSMQTARMAHYLLTGPDGSLLAVGGHGTGFVALASFETWDPVSGGFTQHSLPGVSDNSAVAQVEDGRYLLVGSAANLGIAPGYQHAILLDPATNTAQFAGTPTRARMNAGAARLVDGHVLVAGGWYNQASSTYGELYDPSTNTFIATEALISPRSHPMVFPATDGGAWICGGTTTYGAELAAPRVEYYNRQANQFTSVRDDLVRDDPGWQVPVNEKVDNIEDLRRTNGAYACLFGRTVDGQSEWAVFNLDPATGEFTRLTQPGAFPEGEYPFAFTVDPGSDQMFIAMGTHFAVGAGSEFRLYSVNLGSGAVHSRSDLITVNGYYLGQSRARFLPASNQIIITGGHTQTGYYTNFSPTSATLLVQPMPLAPNLEVEVFTAVELRFVAPIGFHYQCQYTDTLNPANWQAIPDVANIIGDDQEHIVFISFEGRHKDHEFYRVALAP